MAYKTPTRGYATNSATLSLWSSNPIPVVSVLSHRLRYFARVASNQCQQFLKPCRGYLPGWARMDWFAWRGALSLSSIVKVCGTGMGALRLRNLFGLLNGHTDAWIHSADRWLQPWAATGTFQTDRWTDWNTYHVPKPSIAAFPCDYPCFYQNRKGKQTNFHPWQRLRHGGIWDQIFILCIPIPCFKLKNIDLTLSLSYRHFMLANGADNLDKKRQLFGSELIRMLS